VWTAFLLAHTPSASWARSDDTSRRLVQVSGPGTRASPAAERPVWRARDRVRHGHCSQSPPRAPPPRARAAWDPRSRTGAWRHTWSDALQRTAHHAPTARRSRARSSTGRDRPRVNEQVHSAARAAEPGEREALEQAARSAARGPSRGRPRTRRPDHRSARPSAGRPAALAAPRAGSCEVRGPRGMSSQSPAPPASSTSPRPPPEPFDAAKDSFAAGCRRRGRGRRKVPGAGAPVPGSSRRAGSPAARSR